MNKDFVSIYFTPDSLQIMQLGRRKKVSQIASISLPNGLISNYLVKDVDSLTKIIKSSWKKLGIKNHTVGLVIPEFVTLTKLINVPKLPNAELAEAVQWQIQEFLPYGYSEAIADWKTVRKGENDYDILCVISSKVAVLGYVDAVEAAGLLPVLVATPSVILSELVENKQKGSLIVLKGKNEGQVILKFEEKLIGSAVVMGSSFDEILKTIRRISNHYNEVKVEKILVGGLLSNDEIKILHEKFDLPVDWIEPDIKGLTKETVQEYLVPLALQHIAAFEPQDPATINLLPPPLIVKYNSAKRRSQVWGLMLFATLFVWICFFSVLGVYFYLNNQVKSLKAGNTDQSSVINERKEAAIKVKEINETASRALNIEELTVYPEAVFSDIAAAGKTGLDLVSYKFDLEKGTITLHGTASDRSKLVEFKSNLENNPNIGNINIPISNLETETNVEFTLSFDYKPVSDNKLNKKSSRK